MTRRKRKEDASMLPFEKSVYLARIEKAKQAMAKQGIDTLFAVDPANMNYLTGSDASPFNPPQAVVVSAKLSEPICCTRAMDAAGAKLTTFLKAESIIGFPDHYVQSTERHPFDYLAEKMRERGLDRGTIGLEMDAYYFSPMAYESLKAHLPNARFVDSKR